MERELRRKKRISVIGVDDIELVINVRKSN